MQPKLLIVILVCSMLPSTIFAQSNNPFNSIHKKSKITSLFNNKYNEQFDKNDIQQIGSALVNIRTMQVVKVFKDDVLAQNQLNNSVSSRFLSVDPMSHSFAMLTPYQYASDRPIDGIDLDGKEWEKVVTHDPKTGVTNVDFQVKLKLVNDSKIFNDIENLKNEIQKQFASSFIGADDQSRKITYSGKIEIVSSDNPNKDDYSAILYDRAKGNAIAAIQSGTPNTQKNAVSASAGIYDPNNPSNNRSRDTKLVAQDVLHEIFHTADLKHPDDPDNNAADVDLKPGKIKILSNGIKKIESYRPGEKADIDKIVHNIMLYDFKIINGKTVKEYVPDPMDRGKISPDQAKIISNQVDSDTKKKN